MAIRLYDYVTDDGRLIALNNYNEIRGNKVYDTPDVNFEPTYINDKSIFSFSNVSITYYGQTQVLPDPDVRALRVYSEGTQGILIGSKSKDQWAFNDFDYVKSETVKAQCKSFGNVVKDNICEYIYLYNGITTIVESNVGNVILASSVDYVATNTHQVIKDLDNFVYLEKVIDSVDDSLYKMGYTFNENEDLSLIKELTEQTV
jgi:hypothetical protein